MSNTPYNPQDHQNGELFNHNSYHELTEISEDTREQVAELQAEIIKEARQKLLE